MYAGSRALQKDSQDPPGQGEAAVLFPERESDTTIVVVGRTGRGTIVELEMRLIDRLPTGPLAQKILLDVFRRLAAGRNDAVDEGVVR